MNKNTVILVWAFVSASIFIPQFVLAANIYVDKNLVSDCSGSSYSISARDCSGSDGIAFNTINKSLYNATAGYTVYIRNGTYNEILWPRHSGTIDNPITFQPYSGETATIQSPTYTVLQWAADLTPAEYAAIDAGSSGQYGIYIWNKEYIIIEGITVSNTIHAGWTRIVHSNHIILQENKFITGDGGAALINCSYCKVLNNIFYNGSDNLLLLRSDRNLIEGNNFTVGRHSLWSLRGGNFNVIRNNYFYNEIQKIGEVYDNVRTDRPQWDFSNDLRSSYL